ncbi:patatin-like phospholipase [Cordyceps militaris]|uniref:Protoheme IX farnesyltransferase, mitochondrial n=1 Tax=Cordyceps militaris TaxID=73501 RepID=A0A2H4SP52_CORMI|nr:patatin-like phospholipase [Cordyceps militaris]
MRSLHILKHTSRRQCCAAATKGAVPVPARWLSSATSSAHIPRVSAASLPVGGAAFFLSNRLFERSRCLDFLLFTGSARATSTTTPASHTDAPSSQPAHEGQSLQQLPPHRRRQLRKQQQQLTQNSGSEEAPLPPDASSLLTTQAAAQPAQSLRRTLATFLSLSKPRLTVLVVLTAMVPYALYPVPEMLTPSMTDTTSLSPLTLLFLTTGTALCSASANALNMLYEPDTDAKMTRTRNRPLVRRLIATRSAVLFAILAGAVGAGGLYFGVNPTVSFLGVANIVLYAGVYTPLKRVTAFNTWVGALVGGIPPLMGWAAAAGETATRDGSWRELLLATDGSSLGGWLMAGLLFAWQFPHFMALSWPIRDEYKAAGLRMLAWTNSARNGRVALRYSLVFIPLCVSLCAAGVTEWSFAVTSLPVNLWLAREAVRFWKHDGHQGSARGLFWASVWHLPAVLMLAMLQKKDLWSRAWRGLFGEAADEEGLWEEQELEEMAGMTADRVKEAAKALDLPRR